MDTLPSMGKRYRPEASGWIHSTKGDCPSNGESQVLVSPLTTQQGREPVVVLCTAKGPAAERKIIPNLQLKHNQGTKTYNNPKMHKVKVTVRHF